MSDAPDGSSLHRLLEAVLGVSSDLDLATVLHRIVSSAADLVDARYGALGVLDPSATYLTEFVTVGVDDDVRRDIGDLPHGHGILGLLIVEPEPLRLPDLARHPESYGFPPGHPPMTSFLGVPIRVRDHVFGNLYLTDKTSAATFSDVDEDLVVALASAAAVAIENARLHARVRDLALLADRERIARDLHDTVIQRLFATGLALQGTARIVDDAAARERIEAAVEELDRTVRQIRAAIFDLETGPGSGPGRGVRAQVLVVARDAGETLGFAPRVLFDGPVDSQVTDEVAEELLAVLAEALTNVVRHARASSVDVSVGVGAGGDVVLRVVDDGVGPLAEPESRGPGRGVANMAQRANRLGGTLGVAAGPAGTGTALEWRVPAT